MLPTTNKFCPQSTKRHSSCFSDKKSLHPNVPLHPSVPPSPNTQQQNSKPARPNDLPIPNPVFAPNLIARVPHAPLINQPLARNPFQNNSNQVHKVVRSVATPVPNIPNIPLGQHFFFKYELLAFSTAQTVNSQPRHYHRKLCASKCTDPYRTLKH